ncbi:MAG: anti-sigma factor antagonist [Clostridia bacterium]|nr:anti-sigma factor antagonist [Clostridia bacterium]
MFVNYEISEKVLEVTFEEEIDHHSCLKFAIMIDDAIKKFMPKVVQFNFGNVTFMDSSGIGMLIGRYRKIIRNGGKAEIVNLKPELYRIFNMSGILKIMPLSS